MCRGGGPRAQELVRVGVVPTTHRALERARLEVSQLLVALCQVKSSQGLLFSEARKPCAEAAGHGRRGWCARVWSPPPPGLSKESGER